MTSDGASKIPFVCCVTLLVVCALASRAYAGDGEVVGTVGVLVLLSPVLAVRWFVKRTKAADTYRIWYGTNRKWDEKDSYGPEIDEVIHYGTCDVAIPKAHKFGSIGSSPVKRWFMRRTSGSDDQLSVRDISPMGYEDFIGAVRYKLVQSVEPTILVYIHGYNVDFRNAALRAAQIGFDLKVPGVTALFSWPSSAQIAGYFSDCDNIDLSEAHIAEFFQTVSSAHSNAVVNVIAHSLGNRGLLRALRRASDQAAQKGVKFGQIFLAAPDVDARLFRQPASVYPQVSKRTTLYVSAADRALLASKLVHENPRAGYTPPLTVVDGIDTVEATNVDLDLLGHGYYADAAGVLYDMANLIRLNQVPDLRPGLDRLESAEGQTYWAIRAQN